MDGGHWICSYFDTDIFHICESPNIQKLNNQIINKLKMLFGDSLNEEDFLIHRVQSQNKNSDCGRYAIANAENYRIGYES